jgi:hypothetical protein
MDANRNDNALTSTRKAVSFAQSRLSKWLRVTTYLMFVTIVLSVVAARTVYGKAKASAVSIGDELLKMSDGSEMGSDVYRIRLNGAVVNMTNAQTSAPLKVVLDRFQNECEHHADGMSDEFTHFQTALNSPSINRGYPGIAALRDERKGRGVVACFATGEETDYAELGKRLLDFSKTNDLASIGKFRYIVARTNEDGGTFILVSWMEGSFDLGKMFPKHGDVPGIDVQDTYRPENSRRILSANAEGAPYGVVAYEVNEPQEKVLAGFDLTMPKKGWDGIAEVEHRAPHARSYQRGGVDLLVTTEPNGKDTTLLSVIEMRPRVASVTVPALPSSTAPTAAH